MRKYPDSELIKVTVDRIRDLINPTYFIFEYGSFIGEFDRTEAQKQLASYGISMEQADTCLHLVHNFHGVKINPKTKEFRGTPVTSPELAELNPELAYRDDGRKLGIRVDGFPIRNDTPGGRVLERDYGMHSRY